MGDIMAHTCSECTYLNLNNEYSPGDGRYRCDRFHEWKYANATECSWFCNAYSRSYYDTKRAYEYSEKKKQENDSFKSPCFITTIVCQVLGFKDTTKVLNSLRTFRNNVLKKDEKYKDILATYDIIGPIIADRIRQDELRDTLAVALFNTSIKSVYEFIENNDYLKAIKIYQEMVYGLVEYYDIKKEVSNEQLNTIDITKSGHGKFQKLSLN